MATLTTINLKPMGEKYLIEQHTDNVKDQDALVSRQELGDFMKKKFEPDELTMLRKAIKMFKSSKVIIKKGRNEKY